MEERHKLIEATTDRAHACRRMTAPPPLTLRQALLIVDAVNGLYSTDRLARTRLLAREVAAVIELGAPEIWAADGLALLCMIEAWTTCRRLAVMDAAERFWACAEGGYEEGLRAVGLLPEPRVPQRVPPLDHPHVTCAGRRRSAEITSP
ncbi:hypothetical protein [Nonomuraea sp. NPDC003804]|uniref:hypothetical protein n=1 Tax=Nonomuraea sp. NPDC003804 TaxID=3154547 RepID=UPI0033B15D11